ncbi:MAG: hypothetical protein NVS1B13_14280 [Flavisolibacter sp.]
MSSSITTQTTLVQMRLQPKTMERIEHLSEITGTTNRTQLVATSIELAEELMKNEKEGGKIFIEKPDGTRERIKIVGL